MLLWPVRAATDLRQLRVSISGGPYPLRRASSTAAAIWWRRNAKTSRLPCESNAAANPAHSGPGRLVLRTEPWRYRAFPRRARETSGSSAYTHRPDESVAPILGWRAPPSLTVCAGPADDD